MCSASHDSVPARLLLRSPQVLCALFLAALLAGPLVAGGDEAPPIRADFSFASRHVFRGIERAGPSAQAVLEFSGGGFRGGAWTNLPFAGGAGREVNLNAAYAWQPAENLTLEASLAHHWYSAVSATGTRHSLETGLIATLATRGGFTPSLAYFHDFRWRSDTVQAALAHSIALTRLGAFLDLGLFAGWATGDDWRPDRPGPPRHDGYGYWGAEAHLPYRFGSHSTAVVGLHYAEAWGRSAANGPFGRTSRQNLWITLGVSLDF